MQRHTSSSSPTATASPSPTAPHRVAALVRAQPGADLVVLPELWPQGGFAYDAWEAEARAAGRPGRRGDAGRGA